MLILAFALAGAIVAPAPEPQRARRARVTRAPKTLKPLVRATPAPRDRNAQYRLTGLTPELRNGKDVAVTQSGMACGTTGAPVCPSKGTPVVKAAIDD